MNPDAWAGMCGTYELSQINYEIHQRQMTIAAHTQRMLTELPHPYFDFPAAIAWQNEQLQELLTTKRLMEKANERTD